MSVGTKQGASLDVAELRGGMAVQFSSTNGVHSIRLFLAFVLVLSLLSCARLHCCSRSSVDARSSKVRNMSVVTFFSQIELANFRVLGNDLRRGSVWSIFGQSEDEDTVDIPFRQRDSYRL